MRKIVVSLIVLFTLSWPVQLVAEKTCDIKTSELFQKISPAVVSISTLYIDHYSVQERLKVSSGSGFIVEPSGFILTNSHVVYGKKAIKVQLSDGREFPAILVGADPMIDIAVIKIGVPGNRLPIISLADWDALKVGQDVLAIGYPLGFDQTLTRGIISAVNRVLSISPMSMMIPMLQTDASINPGNSGGPLVDYCGRVVGINTSVIYGAENIGFSIPGPVAREAFAELIKHNRIIRPWLGLNGKLIKKSDIQSLFKMDVVDGFMIETIEPDSPAEDVGLVGGILQIQLSGEYYLFGGDIITSINGKSLNNSENYLKFAQNLKVGDKVRLEIYRHGKKLSVELKAVERPILPWDLPPDSAGM